MFINVWYIFRRPLHSWYQCWHEEMLDAGYSDVRFSYNEVRLAWQSFLKLIITVDEFFWCRKCSPSKHVPPSTVLCDGTAIAFQRRMLKHTPILEDNKHLLQGI